MNIGKLLGCLLIALSLNGDASRVVESKTVPEEASPACGAVPNCQSPLNPALVEEHARRKRHTADHLITDNYSRLRMSRARKQILAKLLKLAGFSTRTACQCGSSSRDIDSRFKGGADRKSRKPHMDPLLDCNCDIKTMISYLRNRLSAANDEKNENGEPDPLTEYVAGLSDGVKRRLGQFLREEGLRIKRNEILRRIRIRRLQLQLLQRRRLLRNDPNAAFRGKQFLSF